MREMLQITDDAHRAHLTTQAYIDQQKKRIALHERIAGGFAWESAAGLGVLASFLGAGAMYAMGAKLAGRKKTP
jgi:hypothetical protein